MPNTVYTTTSTELIAVANAIRTKGGTSSPLAFPNGFVSAIGDIPTGGTLITKTINENGTYSAEDDDADGYSKVTVNVSGYSLQDVFIPWDGAVSGDIEYNGNSLPPFAFLNNKNITGFTSNTLQYMKGIDRRGNPYGLNASNTFNGCTALTKVSIPNLTGLAYCDNSFRNCSALSVWNIPFKNFQSIGAGTFYNCRYLPSLVLRSLDDPFYSDTFYGCTSLTYIDCGESLTSNRAINGNAFKNASNLSVLVFRSAAQMFTLSNISAFDGTPFASNGTGGTLYVPQTLISSYQSASNWSTILGYTNNQIKSIESTHTDPTAPIDLTLYYADGTPIT